MLRRGDAIPHFTVRTPGGDTVEYANLWQHRNLVLISLSAESEAPADTAQRFARAATEEPDTTWVVTHEAVEGVPQPGVVVADRWGEIVHIAALPADAGLPDVDELREWVHFTQMRCPECEGETR